MPGSRAALRATDDYRRRLRIVQQRAVSLARGGWRFDIDNLDRDHAQWVERTAAAARELQAAGVALSTAYLSAYLTLERGEATSVDAPSAMVGVARDGRPLAEALAPSLFTIKQAIGEGRPVAEAFRTGLNRAVRVVGEEAIAPARAALDDSIREDDRIVGWRRVTAGGCLACIAAATGAVQADDETLEVHDHCQCTKEPVVGGVRELVQRRTGPELFNSLPEAEQDARYGKKAELLRDGEIGFQDLIKRDHMAVIPDVITEAPLEALNPS